MRRMRIMRRKERTFLGQKPRNCFITSLFAYLYYRYRGTDTVKGDGIMPSLDQIGTLIRLFDS